MYKLVSSYKLNTRSKSQNLNVKVKDTAFLTYLVVARFKFLCVGLVYSLQVNAPKINRL
jgi:hypothetical protein